MRNTNCKETGSSQFGSQAFVDEANRRGGLDNVTVIVVRIGDESTDGTAADEATEV